jgi:hypothetical protein
MRSLLPNVLSLPERSPLAPSRWIMPWTLTFLASTATQAQQSAAIPLGPVDSFSGTEFTLITSVRGLSGGRLLAADLKENRLNLIDWARGRVTLLGRSGDGPGEYEGVGWLHPLADDSTLLTDRITRRWHIVHGQRLVSSSGADRSLNRQLGPLLSGADTLGHVLGVTGYAPPGSARASRDDAELLNLLLGDRSTERLDTLARIGGMGAAGRIVTGGAQRSMISSHPLATEEQALLFPDGWVAVARLDPYRVDWRTPAGEWVHGDPLPFERIPVDSRERCAALGQTRDFCNHRAVPDWPDALPPFLRPARPSDVAAGTMMLQAAPDGRLLIRRTPSVAVQGTRYDAVDRRGRLTGTITLPANEAIVGAGARHLYTVATDEFDLQHLRRYAWH